MVSFVYSSPYFSNKIVIKHTVADIDIHNNKK